MIASERRDRPSDADDVTYLGYGRFRVNGPVGGLVRIPDPFLKCVAYIGETSVDKPEEEGDLLGTGFFVSVPAVKLPGLHFQAFVTVRHVAQDLSKGQPFYVLVNRRGGGVYRFDGLTGPWWLHPDPKVDVALILVEPRKEADYLCVALDRFVTANMLDDKTITIGDEVFSTGLFTLAPGAKENMPIIRHGNIAMLPKEQIQTEMGFTDVYLVEVRSIGGLSGSPVFVRKTVIHGQWPNEAMMLGEAYLLGMMHGHWDIKESEMNDPYYSHDSKRGVNMGIGIVVPASKIQEVLYLPALVAKREWSEAETIKGRIPSMD